MHVDELTRSLHAADTDGSGFDPTVIRRRGRRLRLRRRLAVGGGVAVLAVAGGTAATVGMGGPDEVNVASSATDTLTGWERRVLDAVPDSYASGGTVVVPGPLDPDSELNTRIPDEDVVGTPQPLGVHGYTDPGYLDSRTTYPRIIQERQELDDRTGKDVVADNGETYLGCVEWDGNPPCAPAVLVGAPKVGWFYLYGLGTDDFLATGSDMELFIDQDYTRGGVRHSLIGGLPGTDAARVELTLVDGSRLPATVDQELAAGDTMFWADTEAEVARVTAYDEQGEVVAGREVRDCDDPVDCEVR